MTIFFIDDDADDIDLFCEAVNYLNSSEFVHANKELIHCLSAQNGRKAIEELESMPELPDYIFMDINMPIMGGKECLTALKSNPKFLKIPVIMLSTAFRDNSVKEFKALGATDCIVKPRGFNELIKIFSKYVYKRY